MLDFDLARLSCAEVANLQRRPTREQIERYERELCLHPARIEFETRWIFCDGLATREIFIPAGASLTGMAHLSEHLNILESGTITVWTEDGMKTLTGPLKMVSRAGTKRVGLAHTDVVWSTIHANPTNERDEQKLIAMFCEPAQPLPSIEETRAMHAALENQQ